MDRREEREPLLVLERLAIFVILAAALVPILVAAVLSGVVHG